MRRHLSRCLPLAAGIATLFPTTAQAHVKWFSPYDINDQPQQIELAFNTNFLILIALSILLLLIGCTVESLPPGRALLRGINTLTKPLEANADVLIRSGCGFFLVALWTLGGIILTPELKTGQPWIPWLQLAMAACLLWRRTLVLAGLGLIALYGIAVYFYGIFHLLDYPIFIGLALYFITLEHFPAEVVPGSAKKMRQNKDLEPRSDSLGSECALGSQITVFGFRAVDALRASVAITLMWASVEKWAYPQWSYPIIESNPALTMGFSREFYMQAAGLVEYALSFAILLGPLVRRTAAAILLGIFISAIGPFGKIDAIGHAPIIAVLAVVLGDSAPGRTLLSFELTSARNLFRSMLFVASGFGAILASFVAAYYTLHTELYPNSAIALCACPAHVASSSEQPSATGSSPQNHELMACRLLRESSSSRSHFLLLKSDAKSLGHVEQLRPQHTQSACEIRSIGGIDATLD